MPVPQNLDLDLITEMELGHPLIRPTSSIAAGGTIHLFAITGGLVMIQAAVGKVTTIIQAQATTAKLTATPSAGSAVDLCATSDLTGKEAGSLLSITGLASDALVMNLSGATALQIRPVLVMTGYLDLILGAASTGAIQWTLRWSPWDLGAAIVAV